MEKCPDCDREVEPTDMTTCAACGEEVCRWCIEGRVCHGCLEQDEADSR